MRTAPTKPPISQPATSDHRQSLVAGIVRKWSHRQHGRCDRVVGIGRQPFLGTAQVRFNGPLTLKLRARSKAGGKGRVHWRTAGQDSFPESSQIATYDLPAGTTWQDVSVSLPVQGKPTLSGCISLPKKRQWKWSRFSSWTRGVRKKSWDLQHSRGNGIGFECVTRAIPLFCAGTGFDR